MEPGQPAHPLRAGREEGGPEVPGAFLLAEARAGHDADAGGVEDAEAVEFVRLALLLGRLLDGFARDGDGGEEIHGALEDLAKGAVFFKEKKKKKKRSVRVFYLRVLAFKAFHRLECVEQSQCSLM